MSTASAEPGPAPAASASASASAPVPVPVAGGWAPSGIVPGGIVPSGIVLAGIGDEAAPDLPGQLDAVRELGWNRIELRTIAGVPIARLDEEAFALSADRIRTAGVAVVGVASKIGDWSRPVTGDFALDLAELEVLARRCPVLGTRLVRVMSYPSGGLPEAEWGRRALSRLRELTHRAEDAGLLLTLENCAGWAGDRAERMLDLVAAIDSPAFRLLFDIGNGVAYGYSPPEMLAAVVGHVAHVHVKDAVIASDGEVGFVPPGTGAAHVAECLRMLLTDGYTGALSIEPHLHLRPHLSGAGDPGRGDRAAFVAYGRELERLVGLVAPAEGAGRTR
ncbi:sugar phosphate isomerase/epimerase family protein [Sphaerimonospora sp. CA-214678]|uniref:sugar phosphate isomerase/epimerase family protein n=1 Tax=Sphaerimonospora sp. CA-214678 TaxID=3240029 RepID=UPI003D8DF16E